MRLERFFGPDLIGVGPHSSEVVSSRVPEHMRTASELGQFVVPGEVVLFSSIDGKKDTESPDQAPEINQDVEPIRTSVNGDWEPFNLEPHPSQNFVNLYGGPFSQQMELNRKNAERLLQVAGIEGKVTIADLPMNRSRSIAGVNPDGSPTGRRKLFWGEKIEEEDKSQSLVKPIPQGWHIEIPGQEIMDKLSREESKKPLDKRFVAGINQALRDSLREVIFREKLTRNIIPKTLISISPYGVIYIGNVVSLGDPVWAILPGGLAIQSLASIMKKIPKSERSRSILRSRHNFFELFLPEIEIDRVLRGFSYLNLKGRNLVRVAAR